MSDATLHFAFAIRIGDAARHSHRAVVSEHAAIQRIESRVVDVGFENAFAQVVGHDDLHRATELAEGALVQLGPDARARLKGEQTDAFAAVAECQHKQARAAVFATDWIADRGAGAVIDLRFFARCGGDDGACFGRTGATQFAHEALDAFVGAREAVPVHHLLPDGHGIAAQR